MKIVPLKRFKYSTGDGIHGTQAEIGVDCNIPDELVPGLLDGGYVRMPPKPIGRPKKKPAKAAPENKDAGPSPENKAKPKYKKNYGNVDGENYVDIYDPRKAKTKKR